MKNNKIRKNFFQINNQKYIEKNTENIKKATTILNKDKLIIISGQKSVWKINFIKEFIHKTNSINSYFYFNKSDDIEDNINWFEDLINLFNEYLQLYKNPNIVILQNINKITWIKDFITHIYKTWYKTILVWNNIKIWGIKEIEILNNTDTNSDNIEEILKYWLQNEVIDIKNIELKEKYIKLLTNDIFLNDIYNNFSVKRITLYKYTLSYLANFNKFISLRELQKQLDLIQKISLKTTIDYVDFSLQVKIIKKCYIFDIKRNKSIQSKAKYYFSDNWIRNWLTNFSLDNNLLLENLIYNKLEFNNYDVYSWLNWKFHFTFYWINKITSEYIYIHISEQSKKEEIKKEVNKLLKLWNKWKKYLLVDSIETIWIKKLIYDSVEIVGMSNFLNKI